MCANDKNFNSEQMYMEPPSMGPPSVHVPPCNISPEREAEIVAKLEAAIRREKRWSNFGLMLLITVGFYLTNNLLSLFFNGFVKTMKWNFAGTDL